MKYANSFVMQKIVVFFIIGFFGGIYPVECEENIFYYGDFGQIDSLNPVTSPEMAECRLSQFIFDSLIIEDNQGNFIFSLTESVDVSPDGLSFTFILRPNILWEDGTPLTAKDIEFTLQVILNPKTENYLVTLAKFIEDVIVIDPLVLTINLSRPFYQPLSLFTFKILPKHKFTTNYLTNTDFFVKNPIGCGPFKYLEGLGTETIILVRNENFKHRQQPFLEKIILKLYNDKEQAHLDFLEGKLHFLVDINSPRMEKFFTEEDVSVSLSKSTVIHFISFNYQSIYGDLLYDHRLRKSLLQAINRSSICSKIFGADSQNIVTGPFPRDSWAYNHNIQEIPYSVEEASQTLEDVLFEKGFIKNSKGKWEQDQQELTFTIVYPPGQEEIEAVCREMAYSLSQIGIMTNLLSISPENNFDLSYNTYTFKSTLDLISFFNFEEKNFWRVRDSKLEELLNELHNTLNPWSIQHIFQKIHALAHKETMQIFLWQLDIYAVHVKKLKNFKIHPYYFFYFPESWKIISD